MSRSQRPHGVCNRWKYWEKRSSWLGNGNCEVRDSGLTPPLGMRTSRTVMGMGWHVTPGSYQGEEYKEPWGMLSVSTGTDKSSRKMAGLRVMVKNLSGIKDSLYVFIEDHLWGGLEVGKLNSLPLPGKGVFTQWWGNNALEQYWGSCPPPHHSHTGTKAYCWKGRMIRFHQNS